MNNDRCCCSKESMGSLPLMRIIDKLDGFFSHNDLAGAERLLTYWENEARSIKDNIGLTAILSEQAGLYRRNGDSVKGLSVCEEAVKLIDSAGLSDSVSGATVLLNCATTMKAFGKAEEAIPLYEIAEKVYEEKLPEDDLRRAGLYNNKATAFAELKETDKAVELYLKAIDNLNADGVLRGEVAVSYINLAQLLYENDPLDEKVYEYMDKAKACLDSSSLEHDGNYAFICSKCAPAFGDMGYFAYKTELEQRAERIYEGA